MEKLSQEWSQGDMTMEEWPERYNIAGFEDGGEGAPSNVDNLWEWPGNGFSL